MRPIFLFFFLLLGLFACEQPNAYGDGAMLYEKHCANCHGDQGEGLEELIPPLAQADALMQAGTAPPAGSATACMALFSSMDKNLTMKCPKIKPLAP